MSRLVDERYLTGGSPELQGFDGVRFIRGEGVEIVLNDSNIDVVDVNGNVETFDDCPGLVPERTQDEPESLDSSEQFFLGSLLALWGVLLYLGAVLVSVL